MEKNQSLNEEKEQKNTNFDCVLLIDDDEITNFINKDILSNLEISESIETTNNIEDALLYIKTCYLPDKEVKSLFIILDLVMPESDGFDFLDALNFQTGILKNKIDIIILTNSLDAVNKERAEKYNILDYVLKPLTQEKIKQSLQKKAEKLRTEKTASRN